MDADDADGAEDAEAVEEPEEADEVTEGSLVEPGEEPDVLLDVPTLHVDEINLEVEDLRARVSLQAEVLDLLKLNVGADVALGRVELDIKGVDAQALLKVRLDRVLAVVERLLTSVDRNPQILEQLTSSLGSAVRDVGRGGADAVGELGRGVGQAGESIGEGAGTALGEIGEGAGAGLGELGEETGESVRQLGEEAGKAAGGVADGAAQPVEGAVETGRGAAGEGGRRKKTGPGPGSSPKKRSAAPAKKRSAAPAKKRSAAPARRTSDRDTSTPHRPTRKRSAEAEPEPPRRRKRRPAS